jgi:hypothetical protein
MVLGSDRFYRAPGTGQPFLPGPEEQQRADEFYRAFLNLLPPDLARQIGSENAVQIYRLGPRSASEDVPPAAEGSEQ